MMKPSGSILIVLALSMTGCSAMRAADQQTGQKKKILFYSQSCEYRHAVVARPLTGELSFTEKVFKDFATKAGYQVDLSQDYNDLKGDQFKQYDAIVFYTSGDPPINKKGLMKWIGDGGAFVAIHPATYTFKTDPEFIKMVGALFAGHGDQSEAVIKIEVADHPATVMLPKEWRLIDEYYWHKKFSRDNIKVLMSIDTEKTNLKPLKMQPGKDYPMAWINTKGKGRIFYTALGHREDVWMNPLFQKHLLGGIAWALKKNK
ncbi:MAG: ThuA domain-containing protein [Planctomycetota bacterium]|jgi:type 1 glutamine amidotransferase